MGSENRARLAFGALLFATLIAFSQLFQSGPYLGPAVLGAVFATVIAVAARRMGLSSTASLALCAAGLAWYLSAVFHMGRLFYGLPTPASLAAVGASVSRAFQTSNVDFAPVPPRSGYVILLTGAVWCAAALGEVATFRWRQPLLSSVLPTGLFALVMVVGTGQGTWLFLSLWLAALFTFWGVESSYRLRAWGRWVTAFAQSDAGGPSPTASVARRMGASCVAAAVFAPLLLPGIEHGLIRWRTGIAPTGIGSGVGSSQGVNLLVSLAPTLAEQTSREMFVVQADAPEYWRLTSLALFDGRDWAPLPSDPVQLRDGVDVGDYQFPPSPTPPEQLTTIEQRYQITGLGSELLPAATHPATLRAGEGLTNDAVSVDAGSGEIRFATALEPGMTYEVQSRVPRVSFAGLKKAEVGDPGRIYTDLPPDITPRVRDLARRWTRGEVTPFEKLVAIQDRLRRFQYSLDVDPEDSSDYLTEFLTQTRRGYCQQFATAFTVLARLVGLPTRVSVGFLPGAPSSQTAGRYSVTGTDAHAWPEVYFADFGWVAFEPTPRSSAQPPRYTVPAFNAFAGGPGDSGNPGSSTAGIRVAQDERRFGARGFAAPLPGSPRPTGFRNPAWIRTFNRLASALVLLVALFLLGVPVLKEWRIARAYRRARSPNGRVLAAWSHLRSEATDLAQPPRPSESGTSFAARLATDRRAGRRDALSLANLYEAAEYSARGVTDTDAREAALLARRLRRALWLSASWWERARRLFSPAGLGGFAGARPR